MTEIKKQNKNNWILNKLKEEGEKRSYNEIAADFELYLWNEGITGPLNTQLCLKNEEELKD